MNPSFSKFDRKAQETLTLAQEEATRLAHRHVGTEHLLLGILNCAGCSALTMLHDLAVDTEQLRRNVEAQSESVGVTASGASGVTPSTTAAGAGLAVLKNRCASCHDAAHRKGDVVLLDAAGNFAPSGTRDGHPVTVQDLLDVTGGPQPTMPKGALRDPSLRLTAAEIQSLRGLH